MSPVLNVVQVATTCSIGGHRFRHDLF